MLKPNMSLKIGTKVAKVETENLIVAPAYIQTDKCRSLSRKECMHGFLLYVLW